MTLGDTAEENQKWQEVTLCKKKKRKEEEKKNQRKGRTQTTSDAIKVKTSVRTSYMKSKFDPTAARPEITGIRRTREGQILVQLRKVENTEKFREAIAQVLEGQIMVETLSRPYVIEIRDLDESISQQEMQEAVCEATGALDKETFKVLNLRKAYGGMQIAIIGTSP